VTAPTSTSAPAAADGAAVAVESARTPRRATRPAGPPEPRQQDAPVAAEARPAEERESVEGQAETKESCSSESRGNGRSGEGRNGEAARSSDSRNGDDDSADSGGRRGRRARYRDRRR